MSYIIREHVKCAVCGKKSQQPIILSTSTFGGSDLDGRPHGMARNILRYELQECERCGYINYNIEIQPQVYFDEGKLQYDIESELAVRYFKFAKYNERIGDYILAFNLFLSAAWDCDDCNLESDALKMRTEAIRVYENQMDKMADINSKIILIDVYRRNRQFQKAISLIKNVCTTKNEALNKIIDFQQELCDKKDDKCHTTLEIF